jgi:hypothetical protein
MIQSENHSNNDKIYTVNKYVVNQRLQHVYDGDNVDHRGRYTNSSGLFKEDAGILEKIMLGLKKQEQRTVT